MNKKKDKIEKNWNSAIKIESIKNIIYRKTTYYIHCIRNKIRLKYIIKEITIFKYIYVYTAFLMLNKVRTLVQSCLITLMMQLYVINSSHFWIAYHKFHILIKLPLQVKKISDEKNYFRLNSCANTFRIDRIVYFFLLHQLMWIFRLYERI